MKLKNKIQMLVGRLSPMLIVKIMFRHSFGRALNLSSPQDVNEKIQWLKFHADTSKWVRLADKYKVREFVKERGYGDTLVKLYKKWDNIDDITFDDLPQQFVLKTNNGTGDVVIVKDKAKENVESIKQHFREVIVPQNAYMLGEIHYLKIKPCVIAEELLDSTQQAAASTSLIDYKIWCADGKPLYILTCHNRTKDNFYEISLFDTEWNAMPDELVYMKHTIKAMIVMPKPKSLGKMLKMASDLSKGLPVVRVDLYEVHGKVYFGEMTMTPAAGFNTSYSQKILTDIGRQVKLPPKIK